MGTMGIYIQQRLPKSGEADEKNEQCRPLLNVPSGDTHQQPGVKVGIRGNRERCYSSLEKQRCKQIINWR